VKFENENNICFSKIVWVGIKIDSLKKRIIIMKHFYIIFALFMFYSCIPLRIAPRIKDDKVMVAKKFKRKLPKSYAFIFEDPKDANEFYNYINIKYQLNDEEVGWNVPFIIENEELFLTYYEVEIPTKTINLIPIFLDAILEDNDHDPLLEELEFSRNGHWYLVLTVSNSNFEDCLKPNYTYRKEVLAYLRKLRLQYLYTQNYVQVLLEN
jgi:hypothetical protein